MILFFSSSLFFNYAHSAFDILEGNLCILGGRQLGPLADLRRIQHLQPAFVFGLSKELRYDVAASTQMEFDD